MAQEKIIKLRLEDAAGGDKLPKLMDDKVDEKAIQKLLGVYKTTRHEGQLRDYTTEMHEKYFQSMLDSTREFNVNSASLKEIANVLQKEYYPQELLKSKADNLRPVASDKIGLFLSALIENSEHGVFTIEASESIGYIGYRLKAGKMITLLGDAGPCTGHEMSGGEIIIDGSQDNWLGCRMSGGTIQVNGDAKGYTGDHMSGGTINISGRAEHVIGRGMRGGKITIGKNAGRIVGFNMIDGEIHVKGDVDELVGEHMGGGIIRVDGELKGVYPDCYGGEIWQANTKVWSK
ncbi:MAG: hypothetical protein V1921_06595 [Candidatus Altiarchaeota archaeon]